jgi:thiol-disulfide isomerase/thioredoxin
VFTRAIAVAWSGDHWIVVERDDRVIPVRDNRPAFSLETPFAPVTMARFGDGLVAARSPFATSMTPEPAASPLLVELTMMGKAMATFDTIGRPPDRRSTAIANAGHVAGTDSLAFFAFLTRDEIRAYDRSGRRRWTADRGFTWPVQPSIPPGGGPADLHYRPVNLAITTHGGLVYVLAFSDSVATSMRLDAFEAETGVLAHSWPVPTRTPLISADEGGALWVAPADTLNRLALPEGDAALEFRLQTKAGDTLDSRSLRGKVVLVNIWASWCGPCRDEFPLMAQLSRELPAEEFSIVAVSEDRDENAARWFLAEFSPPFTVVWGRGALNSTLRFRGLPFSVLLDRQGRILHRYVGFGGPAQFARMREDIERAIADR